MLIYRVQLLLRLVRWHLAAAWLSLSQHPPERREKYAGVPLGYFEICTPGDLSVVFTPKCSRKLGEIDELKLLRS